MPHPTPSSPVPQVHNFPFPSPPEAEALAAAHRCLQALGALDTTAGAALTATGKAMAAFPISPRHARMLLEVRGRGGAAARTHARTRRTDTYVLGSCLCGSPACPPATAGGPNGLCPMLSGCVPHAERLCAPC
jgi:hypothetical protein